MKPIEKLMDMYSTPTQAGRAIGVSRQVVEHWVKKGFIPYEAATYVQVKTGGSITNSQIWLAADKAKNAANKEESGDSA